MVGQPGFFDLSDRYAALSAAGDPLGRLATVVDFEVFGGPLISALRRSARGKGGRPPFDPVMMFKVLVLQALYSLSDDATEFQIKDRLSFQRFLGLGLDGNVPDATTVWLFRERLVKAKAIDKLFAPFDAALTDRGDLAMGGQIIDAAVVPAPKQRNTDEEKAAIKQVKTPERWKAKPAKVRQKDCDARWTVKCSKAKVKESADPKAFKPVDLAIPMFGYKNRIGIDRAHGLICTWDASAANAHDLRGFRSLSASRTPVRVCGQTPPIDQRRTRRSSSAACSRATSTSGGYRTVGIALARIKIGMANLAYNFQRLAWLEGRGAPA